jgi:nucleoid-associated protein YgaU
MNDTLPHDHFMATRKAALKKNQPEIVPEPQQSSQGWLDYIRFGESYTSLILGVIVVIVTTVLLVFTVKDRSVLPVNGNKVTQDVSSTKIEPEPTLDDATVGRIMETVTAVPTVPVTPTAMAKPTAMVKPTTTAQPTLNPTVRPTIAPTRATGLRPTLTSIPTKPQPSKVIVQVPSNIPTQNFTGQKTYTVSKGDTLWSIAEKFYKSGYNWVDISSANKLSNPGIINTGTKLIIPSVAPKLATVQTTPPAPAAVTAFGPKITGSTYTVQKGDHLWGIAVRAYNDGYKWTEIAKLNNITPPSVIYTGQVLKLPRITSPPAPAK